MNSTLGALLKVQFIEAFDFRKLKNDKKKMSLAGVMVLLMAFFIFLVSMYSFYFCSMLHNANEKLIYQIYIFAGFATIMCCVMSITKISGIFNCKDFDMLQAMPIPKWQILFSKLISLYISIIAYSLVLMIPSTIVTFLYSSMKETADYSILTFGLVAAFFIPSLPLAVGVILSTLFMLISGRFRFGNIIMMIFYFIYLGAVFLISFSFSSGKVDENGVRDVSNMVKSAKTLFWINPLNYFLDYDKYKVLFILLYALINIVLLVIVSLFVGLFYERLHYLSTARKNRKNNSKTVLTNSNPLKTFLRLEFKKFFNSKLYLINGSLSGIICIFVAISLSIQLKEVDSKMISFIMFSSILFMMGIQTPASVSINLEGRNFYILKTMPIDYRKYTFAKVLMSIIVSASLTVISAIIAGILLKMNVILIVLFALGVILFSVVVSCVDLIISLKNPKLDWEDEKQAIKQSTNVLISMLLVMALGIIIIIAGSIAAYFNIYLAFILSDVLIAVLAFGFFAVLALNSNDYIRRIE